MTSDVQPLVKMRSAGRVYGSGETATTALADATCELFPGNRIALAGPSGSGKSTLLHLIAGLDEPTSGSIAWPALGAPYTLRPAQIGVAFQSLSLVPWLSVVENVMLPLQLLGGKEAQLERGMDALRRFGLDSLATKLPEELSGGQAQRVSLVRATITEPKLIIADEPTGQIDRTTASHLIDMLLDWASEAGAAVLVATHDTTVVERFSMRWTMSAGLLLTSKMSVPT